MPVSRRLIATLHPSAAACLKILTVAVLWGGVPTGLARADFGQPVAIRFWPGGVVSLESQWDLEIVIRPGTPGDLPVELGGADLVISPMDASNLELAFRAAEDQPHQSQRIECGKLDHFLDRLPNQASGSLVANHEATYVSANAIQLKYYPSQGLTVVLDGVRIVVPLGLDGTVDAAPATTATPQVDAFLLPALSQQGVADELNSWLTRLQPRIVVVSQTSLADMPKDAIPASVSVLRRTCNTQAVSAYAQKATASPQWIQLEDVPWKMPEELEALFAKKEAACKASQDVFSKLSVKQLNFQPKNGTHTPRWNAEHMMGRELLFFSQIYAKQDAAIQPMNLNPEQMPPAYKAAHPNWNGMEEARQMQRVAQFSRRFAYLLQGLDLKQKAPGSFWTPEGLLKQMELHYNDHTSNVLIKFHLPDWPKE